MTLVERISKHLATLPLHARRGQTVMLFREALGELRAIAAARKSAMSTLEQAERGRIEAAEREANQEPEPNQGATMHVIEAKRINQWLSEQPIRVYEIRFSTMTDGERWRRNHTALVLAHSLQSAIAAIEQHWTGQLIIHQAIHRNDQMHVVFADGPA